MSLLIFVTNVNVRQLPISDFNNCLPQVKPAAGRGDLWGCLYVFRSQRNRGGVGGCPNGKCLITLPHDWSKSDWCFDQIGCFAFSLRSAVTTTTATHLCFPMRSGQRKYNRFGYQVFVFVFVSGSSFSFILRCNKTCSFIFQIEFPFV